MQDSPETQPVKKEKGAVGKGKGWEVEEGIVSDMSRTHSAGLDGRDCPLALCWLLVPALLCRLHLFVLLH